MPDHLGDDMRKIKAEPEQEEKEIKCKVYWIFYLVFIKQYLTQFAALDEGDIALLKTYVSTK